MGKFSSEKRLTFMEGGSGVSASEQVDFGPIKFKRETKQDRPRQEGNGTTPSVLFRIYF